MSEVSELNKKLLAEKQTREIIEVSFKSLQKENARLRFLRETHYTIYVPKPKHAWVQIRNLRTLCLSFYRIAIEWLALLKEVVWPTPENEEPVQKKFE